MTPPKCLPCDTELEEGFIPDFRHVLLCVQPRWVPSLPVKHWFYELKLPERQILVRTFRCPKCGRLESFAL